MKKNPHLIVGNDNTDLTSREHPQETKKQNKTKTELNSLYTLAQNQKAWNMYSTTNGCYLTCFFEGKRTPLLLDVSMGG